MKKGKQSLKTWREVIFWRRSRRCKDNTKMDLRDLRSHSMGTILVAKNRNRWQTPVNILARSFSTGWPSHGLLNFLQTQAISFHTTTKIFIHIFVISKALRILTLMESTFFLCLNLWASWISIWLDKHMSCVCSASHTGIHHSEQYTETSHGHLFLKSSVFYHLWRHIIWNSYTRVCQTAL
jgi:hypothetical protein